MLLYEANNTEEPTVMRGRTSARCWCAKFGDGLGVAIRPADGARLQGPSLHLKVDLGVAVGRLERYVAEPCTNRIDVYAGAEEMHGCRMADGVRTDPLIPQRRDVPGSLVDSAG